MLYSSFCIDHFHIFSNFIFRIVGYDGVQQPFKDYFKFKEDNIYFLMKLCKDKIIWKNK